MHNTPPALVGPASTVSASPRISETKFGSASRSKILRPSSPPMEIPPEPRLAQLHLPDQSRERLRRQIPPIFSSALRAPAVDCTIRPPLTPLITLPTSSRRLPSSQALAITRCSVWSATSATAYSLAALYRKPPHAAESPELPQSGRTTTPPPAQVWAPTLASLRSKNTWILDRISWVGTA